MDDKIKQSILALIGAFGAFVALLMFIKSLDPAWLCATLLLGRGIKIKW